jgi:hypothetical protein
MHAKLVDNEWYINVVIFWQERICKHWVPKHIYLDKFSTYKVNHSKAIPTKDVRTNFDRSMHKLGCSLISANSPQAKWRVERYNRTLQDRLIKEFRLAKITNINDANRYITNEFIPKFNNKFGVKAGKEGDVHIKVSKEQLENLDWVFAKEELRSLWNDYIIQFKNNFYQTEPSKEYTIYPKKQLLVVQNVKGEIRIHAWRTTEEKLVKYRLLDYSTVKHNRAKYYGEKHKIEKEKVRQQIIQRKEERYQLSKQKQIHYRVQKLIEKTQ